MSATHIRQPVDELHEGRQDGGVADLLDDQHGHRRLVPGQTLAGRVLDRPVIGKNMVSVYFLLED